MTFKIILSGVTGRIGKQVLHQALLNTTITSVIALSRRPLPDLAQNAKVKVLVLKDFNTYPDDIITELIDADGAIWYCFQVTSATPADMARCMTTTAGNSVLELDFPRAFANAIVPNLASRGKHFRYVHLSGAMVERDQGKSLWLKANVRKTKGQGESQMIDVAKDPTHNGLWETMIARPGMVVQRGGYIGEASMWLGGSSGSFVRADELALTLIDAVMNGGDELLLPPMLLRRGQELARATS